MTRGKVISILRFFKDIDEEMRMEAEAITELEECYYQPMAAVNMDGMPHGKGGVSKPVESIVMNVPQWVTKKIERKKRRMERLDRIGIEIGRELDGLTYCEKAVIFGFYLDGLTWERISERVNYSPRQCRNIRDVALKQLEKRFSQNKAIQSFDFPKN